MFLVIKHPETDNYTNLFSDEVNKLIQNGYKIQEIIHMSKKIPHYYNRENIFGDDLLLNYMIHMDLPDIICLSSIDKNATLLLHNQHIWMCKINTYMIHGFRFKEKYTLKNYLSVKYADERINYFMCCSLKKSIHFSSSDDLSIIRIATDYKVGCYITQSIIFEENVASFVCTLKNNIKYRSKKVTLSDTKLKYLLFNIFFYFPNVDIKFL